MNNLDLNIFGIASIAFWLFVIILFSYIKRLRNQDKPHYKYYLPNLFYKLVMGISFALVYLLYYEGGDTTAYWEGGVALMNLFFKEPLHYFDQIFGATTWEGYWNYYDHNTGYPPSWIYKEPEGFFVCKVMSVFSFLTFKNYIATTIILSFLISEASWKLFEVFKAQRLTSDRNAAIAALFIPSVSFWCSGIMKDTIILFSLFYMLYFVYLITNTSRKGKAFLLIYMFLLCFLVYKIRPFVLISIIPPLLISISNRAAKFVKNRFIRIVFLRIGVNLIGIVVGVTYLNNSISFGSLSSDKILSTAIITQQDFANNTTYGTKKYNIGKVDGSFGSLVTVAPNAIIAGLYRPYIWEAQSIFMILNGIESILLIYLTIRFIFNRRLFEKIKQIRSNEFLLFSLFFVLIFSYFVGFTAGLFGTLVRFKAPLLPFFAFLLFIDKKKSAPSENLVEP